MYEVIYGQRLDEGITRRTGSNPAASTPIINIRPYTSIITVEETLLEGKCSCWRASPQPPPSLSTSSAFKIVSQHTVTGEASERVYDVVICATGYQRSSWINILKHSDLGKRFGLNPASTSIRLLPASRLERNRGGDIPFNSSNSSPPLTTSSVSTPPTSPSRSVVQLDGIPDDLFVSRSYELLPVSDEKRSQRSRVYVQGVEEVTHGLSDTLLSVVGVRAGEVLADILKSY